MADPKKPSQVWPTLKPLDRVGKFALLVSLFAVFLGLAVIFAWVTGNAASIQINPSFAPVQFNTALGFIFGGLGFLFLVLKKFPAALAFSGITAVIGLLSGAQYLFGWDLGIDEFFVDAYIQTRTSNPGRMAPNSALCFVLLGAAISAWVGQKHKKWLGAGSEILGILIMAVATLAILGYGVSNEPFFRWQDKTQMALLTAIGFLALSLGFLGYSLGERKGLFPVAPLALQGVLVVLLVSFILQTPFGVASGIAYLPMVFFGLFFREIHVPFLFAGAATLFTLVGVIYSEAGGFSFDEVMMYSGLSILCFWISAFVIFSQKKASAGLIEAEKKFRLLTEFSNDIIVQRNSNDGILYISPSVKTHLGIDPGEVKGVKSWDFVHPDDRENFSHWKKTVFEDGRQFRSRTRLKRKDGEYLWFDSVTEPIKNDEGKVVSAVTASRNIDDQMKAEERVRQTQKMEAIGNLTGGVAHDFNNLLTAILGSLQYLKMISDKLPKEALDLIDIALNSGQKGADLTRRLLALSRRQDLKPTVFGVNGLVKNLTPLLKRTIRENIEIEARLLPQEAYIEADQGELENALLNMAVNAQDAMPEGGHLTFEISRQKLSERNSSLKQVSPGDYILISVSDTGVGIPTEIQDKIFEPFFTTKDVGKGTGLGLSMVYTLVRELRGHVSVYSEGGKGTTFKLYFPEASSKKAVKIKKPAKPDLSKKETGTILLVEDDAGVRSFVTRALRAKGYTVLEAGDGLEAQKLVKKHPDIDLLMTDVVLPKGMSGVDIAKRFQKTHPKGGIILSSGHTGTTIQKSGWLEGEVDLLSKPFDLEVLLDRVRREIRKSRK